MPSLAVISRERHGSRAWRRYDSYAFAARDAVVPLVGAEIARAVPAFPIAFVAQGGGFVPVAVLSLVPGQNQFVGPDGQWLGGYVPSVLRGHPFRLVQPAGDGPMVLCVDEDSGLLTEAGGPGEPFFAADGTPAPAVAQILDFLGQVEASRAATARAAAALAEAGAIEPWPVTLTGAAGEQAVTGLHRIAEARLNALEDEAFLKLRAAGALPLAYAQLLSMAQMAGFERLARLQAQLADAKARQQALLEPLFAAPAEDELNFD